MLTPMQHARWNEIRMYYLADSLFQIRQREDELYFLAEYLSTFGGFNPHAIARHMAEYRRSPHTFPHRDEIIILMGLQGLKFAELRKFMPYIPKSTFYDIIKTIRTDVWIHPCLAPDSIKEFAGFLTAYDKIQGGTFHAHGRTD